MSDYLEEGGYKRHKNIYTPPILQLGPFNGVYWLTDVVPELIWIALLQNRFGLVEGNQLALKLSKLLNELTGNKIWNAPVSYFNELSDDEKKVLAQTLETLKLTSKLQSAFEYFTFLYPEFPLAFFISKRESTNKKKFELYKQLLTELSYRLSPVSTFMQATAIDFAFQAEIMTVAPHTSLAQFPEIANYPNTEISKKVASGIRSALNLYFSNKEFYDLPVTWKTAFWNRGLELEKCY